MNGVFNTGLDFWQFILAIIVIVLGIITIRISFKFDVNKYQAERKKSYIAKLQNTCTHMILTKTKKGEAAFQSLFISPPGTIQWQCQRCRAVKYQQDGEFEKQADYYTKNIDEYKKANKRFEKLLKKAGMK